jgi:cobalt/nickel transport system permease protein
MHISEGILSAPFCLAGYALTSLTTWHCLKQINRYQPSPENIPKASLLTAVFFVASSIQIPIPPASVHLVLNGLLGVILGYYAFPAILIGLILQAIMVGHGGLTTLGINAIIMGIPALIAHQIFHLRPWIIHNFNIEIKTSILAFLAGAIALGLSAFIFFSLIITNLPANFDNEIEKNMIYGLIISHFPLMILEGIFTAMVVLFLQRVKPELLPY